MAGSLRAVADTHVVLWALFEPGRLSPSVRGFLEATEAQEHGVGVSAISLCETIYLVEKGRLGRDALDSFFASVSAPDALFQVLAVDISVALALPRISRSQVPDLPDRIIAATAVALDVPLLTKDQRIRDSGIPTIW